MENLWKDLIDGIVTAWDAFWTLWLVQLLWIALCLPVVTIPLAFGGLYYTMRQVAERESTEWRTFFEGARRYYLPAARWTGINAFVIALLGGASLYLVSAGTMPGGDWAQVASGIPLGLLAVWLALNVFTFPFMLGQENPAYRKALRDSALLYLKSPVYTMAFVLFDAAVIALSVWLVIPWFVFTISLTTLMACICVKS